VSAHCEICQCVFHVFALLESIYTSGVISLPGTTPIAASSRPASYASDTDPFMHCEIATITTPRSHASLKARMRSGRWGAFPEPKLSRTTPRMGGARNARMVAVAMPGNRRKVATGTGYAGSRTTEWATHPHVDSFLSECQVI
jgi:hypothetical protein